MNHKWAADKADMSICSDILQPHMEMLLYIRIYSAERFTGATCTFAASNYLSLTNMLFDSSTVEISASIVFRYTTSQSSYTLQR
jgi:hypothetical protein